MGTKLGFGWACLLTSLMVLVTEVRGQAKIFNVMNYSAVADGATDNSQVNSYYIACLLVSLNFIKSNYFVNIILYFNFWVFFFFFFFLTFNFWVNNSKDVFEIFI